jgi:hypothetical protein
MVKDVDEGRHAAITFLMMFEKKGVAHYRVRPSICSDCWVNV